MDKITIYAMELSVVAVNKCRKPSQISYQNFCLSTLYLHLFVYVQQGRSAAFRNRTTELQGRKNIKNKTGEKVRLVSGWGKKQKATRRPKN